MAHMHYYRKDASFRAHHKNLNEERPMLQYQQRKCRPMTLVSGNIRFMRNCGYSQGFSGEGASNDSGVIENVNFQGFRHLRK